MLRDGRLIGELARNDATQESLMRLMAGLNPEAASARVSYPQPLGVYNSTSTLLYRHLSVRFPTHFVAVSRGLNRDRPETSALQHDRRALRCPPYQSKNSENH